MTEPTLPEVLILETDRLTLVVSTDEDPEHRVLLADVRDEDGKVELLEIGISPRNVARLKRQAARSVFRYRSKDDALWITGEQGRWRLRLAVPTTPTVEVVLSDDETARLKDALFSPLPT